MLTAFANSLKVPELRARIIFTLLVVIVVRVGAQITTPGVNAAVLHQWFLNQVDNQSTGSVAALFNIFSGGALENCAVFSLGIMPYISASIMLQLMGSVIPQLAKLQKEDGGRQKIAQWTRYATVILCVFQGYLFAKSFENPQSNPFLPGIMTTIQKMGVGLVANPGLGFEMISVITLTAGTLLLMWLGDQITERGIGNGISLIITIGIVARLPAALIQAWHTFVPAAGSTAQANPIILVIMVAFFFIVVGSIIALTQAQRKISVQYARRIVGRKEFRGGTQSLPLKLNYAGVMPIIFGQALLLFPATIINTLFRKGAYAQVAGQLAANLTNGWMHYVLYSLMIFFFSYFWVAMMFQPGQIAEELKKNGCYIPGVRPCKPTAHFLDYSMSRLAFAVAVFLVIVAILPQLLAQSMNVPYITAQFFGGTSLLIIVGVMLDTMRQIETHLIQRHYDGFLRKGKIRGRYDVLSPVKQGEPARQSTDVLLCVGAALLFICGLASFLNH